MPHSCITWPYVEIKSRFSSCVIEKDVKVNIIYARVRVRAVSNFKAPVAETRIYAGLKIIFLESTVHRISVDALFVHY